MYNHSKLTVEFAQSDYPDMFESSIENDSYFLTQEVKSWLAKNDIKVFVKYFTDDTSVKFAVRFQTPQDASEFMDEYARWGEQKLRLKEMSK
jgi:hypothetical protein